MSLADDFLQDAGVAAPQQSLSAQFMTDAQGSQALPQRPANLQPPQPLSLMDRLLAKVPTGLANNNAVNAARVMTTAAAAPAVGAAQLGANMMPDSTGVPQSYNQRIAATLRQSAEASKEMGPVAAGANEFVGGMMSPVNLVMGARAAAPAITATQRAIQGGIIGGAGGATTPIDTGETGGKFWAPKTVQTALGTGGGAIIAPVLGAIGDRVAAKINGMRFDPTTASKSADQVIESALKDSGQSIDDLPPDQVAQLRKQVTGSLSRGKNLDVAAALRMKDFQAEGITPTLGQVTRDPTQWSEEMNARGVVPVGRPLMLTMQEGNRAVSQGIGQYGANASEAPVASKTVADALRSYDAGQQSQVTAAYNAARASTGKDLDVPLQGLAQDYASVLDKFADKVPSGVRNQFSALGLDPAKPSNQQKVFTLENANSLLQTINDHWTNGRDPPTDLALSKLNQAVKGAITSADASGGPFAPAIALAKQRFQQLDQIPALEAASQGNVDDRFIQKYIINSPSTDQVQKLAILLKQQAPDAFQEARAQLGANLSQAAFGANAANDKTVAQESYNKALSRLGTGKLNAFFEPDEVEQLKRLGRISAYQVATPAASNANYSNTASAMANLLRMGSHLPMMKGPMQLAGDKVVVNNALNANVPVTPNLTPEQRVAMSRALLAITGGAAATIPGRLVGQ